MIKKASHWIPVVAGIIRKEDKVLIGLRPEGHSLPGKWEFPGGKIEIGELPPEALKRELKEELAIDAEIGKLLLAHTHSFKDKGILLLFYDVPFWKGEPKSEHHTDIQWIRPKELESLNIPDANKVVLKLLF